MTSTGRGSENDFYKDGTNLNKVKFPENRLREIAEMKRKPQKSHLISYFLQMDEASTYEKTENNDKDSSDNANETDGDDLEVYRTIINALDGNLDKTMLLESQEDAVISSEEKATYDEFLSTATRHAFFGASRTQFGTKMASKELPQTSAIHRTTSHVKSSTMCQLDPYAASHYLKLFGNLLAV